MVGHYYHSPITPEDRIEMKAKSEIKRIFPNCGQCGNILAQCCCAAARNEFDALSEYMTLRTQIGVLELRESECKCGDFYTCDLCRESSDLNHRAHGLIELWADNWAIRLWAEREGRNEQTDRGQGPIPSGLARRDKA